MGKSINLDDGFVLESTIRAKASGRSLVQKIEYDVTFGRIAIDNPNLSYAFIQEALLVKDDLEGGELTPYVRKMKRSLGS
ncbi:TA system antitoxin ParD family protein [Zhongshania marina]|uniref:TA system antitoxin ParD family protein n=1 Tax=Zhongshania marina TaxID=2304603 RepID=UPI0013144B1B